MYPKQLDRLAPLANTNSALFAISPNQDIRCKPLIASRGLDSLTTVQDFLGSASIAAGSGAPTTYNILSQPGT